MIATILHKGETYRLDFFKPIDISMPLHTGAQCASAWYVPPMQIQPVRMGNWVGDVNAGGSVNFRTITFNPHGNGTHTECVGHISKEPYSINKTFQRFAFIAELITLLPQQMPNGDFVITAAQLKIALSECKNTEAVIIRTLSNSPQKLIAQYSNTNPPYLEKEAIDVLNEHEVEHLLIDMPSIDKEIDDGQLAAHHAFWNYPKNPQHHKTITELIYVPNAVADGTYFLHFQIAPFENDASPSKPVLYKVL